MNRRELIQGIGATLAATSTSSLLAKSGNETKAQNSKSDALVDAAQLCVKSGNACIEHCIDLITKGDKSMAACLATSRDMVAFSELVIQLASSNSPHLAEALKVSAKATEDCAKACDEHANHHAVCKTCADCCKAASKAYRA